MCDPKYCHTDMDYGAFSNLILISYFVRAFALIGAVRWDHLLHYAP